MVDLADPKTFWLNVTNIGMGLVVLAALLTLIVRMLSETVRRQSSR